jgi:ribosome-binding protein aMBF1 (putative translation factor)
MSNIFQDWNTIVIRKPNKEKEIVPKKKIENNENKVTKIYDGDNEPEIRPVIVSKELGQQIAKKRCDKKLSQKQLANTLSIPVSIISDYEQGKGVYNINYINKIKKHLGF